MTVVLRNNLVATHSNGTFAKCSEKAFLKEDDSVGSSFDSPKKHENTPTIMSGRIYYIIRINNWYKIYGPNTRKKVTF